MKKLPRGNSDFKSIITENRYYVDKSNLVKDVLDMDATALLITRPRRFGKTLNMSMLRYFFEDERDRKGKKIDNKYLFNNLEIMQAGEKYIRHMGTYPVITLTFKDVKAANWEDSFILIKKAISYEFKRFGYILQSDEIDEYDKEKYRKIMHCEGDSSLYIDALLFLSELLNIYFSTNVIVLIDEYDVPLENSHVLGFYNEMINFMRNLFSSTLKDNMYLKFSIITGCLRISKESIFTGLNNLTVLSILNNACSTRFGFTESEVKELLEVYHLTAYMEQYKEWYNGYKFGNVDIYNPWDIVSCINAQLQQEERPFQGYWINSSGNRVLHDLLNMATPSVKREIEALIKGESIIKPLHEDITYEEVYKDINNLWNFLFFTGYLRKDMVKDDDRVELSIPNTEIKACYEKHILKWMNEEITRNNLTSLYDAMLNRNVKKFNSELNDLLLKTISFHDAQENFYHGFMAGILLGLKEYIVKSNRETGNGRNDIMIIPTSRNKSAIILEFKVANSSNELEDKANEALAQIERQNYSVDLEEARPKDIIKYGIAFYRKECYIVVNQQ